MSELVKRIRSFRVDNDLSLFDMAKSIGFSSAKLSQFECGNVEIDITDIDKILSFISASQSEWISADYILPERLVNVLVKQIYQDEIMLAHISACGKLWIESCENACVHGDAWLSKEICKVDDIYGYLKITHWMPLPTPPKDLK